MTVINIFDDNETLWAAVLNALANVHGAGGIVSGCGVTKGTGDWDVDVAAGTITEADAMADVSAGTVALTAPGNDADLDAGESRVDLVHVTRGDTLAATEGTAAAKPASPDIPAGAVLVGVAVVAAGDATLGDSDLIDVPALAQPTTSRSVVWSEGFAPEFAG